MEWIVRNHVGLVPIYLTALMWTGLVIPDVVLDIETISARKVWVFVSLLVNLYSFIQSFIHETALIIILHSILNLILNRCFNMTRKWFAYKFAITPYILGLICFSCNLNLFIHAWNSIEIKLILHNIYIRISKRCFTMTKEKIAY